MNSAASRSPVLPAPLLVGFGPLEDLRERAATGPLADASALAGAPDVGAAGYATVLQRLVGPTPAPGPPSLPPSCSRSGVFPLVAAATLVRRPTRPRRGARQPGVVRTAVLRVAHRWRPRRLPAGCPGAAARPCRAAHPPRRLR